MSSATKFQIYFYDLPKKGFTFTKLANLVQAKTGVQITHPKIFSDSSKKFLIALVRVSNSMDHDIVV
jgi:hypothetical protein